MNLVLTTLLYEGNYEKILTPTSWFLGYQSASINSKLIIVNNVNDRIAMEERLKEVQRLHPSLDYFFVDDYEQQAIDWFKLDIDKHTTIGYYYIIPYFATLLKLQTGLMLHVSDDCPFSNDLPDEFIVDSCDEVLSNKNMPLTTLSWGVPKSSFGYDPGQWEEIDICRIKQVSGLENVKFWHTTWFSDQVFLANVDSLKNMNYNRDTRDMNIGTSYCPDSFERRLSEELYHANLYQGVWKQSQYYYIHEK